MSEGTISNPGVAEVCYAVAVKRPCCGRFSIGEHDGSSGPFHCVCGKWYTTPPPPTGESPEPTTNNRYAAALEVWREYEDGPRHSTFEKYLIVNVRKL